MEAAIAALACDEAGVVAHPKVRGLLSRDHFSVDGTLIEAWASMKSFRPKDGSGDEPPGQGRNGERDFHGEKRSNESHASTTDPDARLYRKGLGKEAQLCFMGHVLMENRNGLAVDGELTRANGAAETAAAIALVEQHGGGRRVTVGADKAFDTAIPARPSALRPCNPRVPLRANGRCYYMLSIRYRTEGPGIVPCLTLVAPAWNGGAFVCLRYPVRGSADLSAAT